MPSGPFSVPYTLPRALNLNFTCIVWCAEYEKNNSLDSTPVPLDLSGILLNKTTLRIDFGVAPYNTDLVTVSFIIIDGSLLFTGSNFYEIKADTGGITYMSGSQTTIPTIKVQ